ncbi:MAG: type II secretion system protein GspC [Gammaproteobacteria bacterium]|nr:type II secretion system protein GspC [Gammaproteobacteria bacterium]
MHTTWQDWLATNQARTGARLLTLVLAVLVVYQLARLTWQLVPAPDAPPAPAAPANAVASAPTARDRDRPSAGHIAGWHLFGQAEPGTGPGGPGGAAGQVAPIDAPETRLNLTLRGLFATEDPERARAIIAAPDTEERSYRVNDELPGGAELSAIYVDRIILQRNGRYETLRLPREALEDGAAAGGGGSGNLNPRAGEILAEYRGMLETNPQALADLMRPVPVNENNRFVGFRLYPGNRPELFQQLGLRPGDLVTRVNGVELDSATRAAEVLQSLRDSQQVTLQLRRGNQELDLAFSLP